MVSKEFSDMLLEAQAIKEHMMDFIKMNNLCSVNNTIKITATDWEKVFTYPSIGFISRIYREFSTLSMKTNNSIKNGQKI